MKATEAKKRLKGFKATPGARFGQDKAAVYGAHLLKMAQANNDTLLTEDVLADATNPESPLHEFFEWDDAVAAKEYRLSQARHLCNHINVVFVGEDGKEQELPVLLNIKVEYIEDKPDPWPEAAHRGGGIKQAYATSPSVMSDKRKHDFLVRQLLQELESLQAKYAMLTDDAVIELFEAIQRTRDKLLNALK